MRMNEQPGLRLSISDDITIRKHCGTLAFTSHENEVTTFRIVLPIHRNALSEEPHE